jgi:hypothetical protein
MAYARKLPRVDPSHDWGPLTTARFQTQDARDQFLRSVANTQDGDWVVAAMPDDGRGAQVRWHPGQFLGLNDIAYAHGGRIVVTIVRRSMV